MSFADPFHEQHGEAQNFLTAFAQRRDAHAKHVQPMKQVLAKLARRHELLEIAVRRGNQAHIDSNLLVPAEPPDATVFNGLQHLGLKRRRQTGQLVEKQSPAVRRFEKTDACGPGVRERAALVSEQFRFRQRVRQCRTIHLHQRLRRPRSAMMKPAGDGGFARARLAFDQHGREMRLNPLVRRENFSQMSLQFCHRTAKEKILTRLRRIAAPMLVQARRLLRPPRSRNDQRQFRRIRTA